MSKSVMLSREVLDALEHIKSVEVLPSYDAAVRKALGLPLREHSKPGPKPAKAGGVAGRPIRAEYAPLHNLAVGETVLLPFKFDRGAGEASNYHALRGAVDRARHSTGFKLSVNYKGTGWLVTRVA